MPYIYILCTLCTGNKQLYKQLPAHLRTYKTISVVNTDNMVARLSFDKQVLNKPQP